MRTITVQTSFEDLHCWPDAPDEVAFLRNPHRHVFMVTVEMEVFHNDREVEFIMLKRKIDQFISEDLGLKNLTKSCESIAERIGHYLRNEYGFDRDLNVSVFEDGENGATIYFNVE